MNSNDVFKQLAINSLLNSSDLQEQVKQFVFYDKLEAESRRKKKLLIHEIKHGLQYSLEHFGIHWSISHEFNGRFLCWEGQNCPCCGGYYIVGHEEASIAYPSIACQCDDEYAQEMLMLHFSFVPQQHNYGN